MATKQKIRTAKARALPMASIGRNGNSINLNFICKILVPSGFLSVISYFPPLPKHICIRTEKKKLNNKEIETQTS